MKEFRENVGMSSNSKINWQDVSIGEICEFKYGKSLTSSNRLDGDIPVYGSNGIIGYHNEPITDGITIVIGRKGSFGEINLSLTPCYPIDTTYYIDSNATDSDLRWLAYQLSYLKLTTLNRAAAVPGLNREDAYRKRLLLPPIDQQKRIAAILDKAEELRRLRRQSIEHLDVLSRSIFIKMFGDPITNPKGWLITRLSEVSNRITDGTHQPPKWSEDGIPFLFISNIINDKIDFNTKKFISEETYIELTKRCPIELGDIVYTTVGSYGNVAVVTTTKKFAFQRHIAHIKPKKVKINSVFMISMLQSNYVRRQVDISS